MLLISAKLKGNLTSNSLIPLYIYYLVLSMSILSCAPRPTDFTSLINPCLSTLSSALKPLLAGLLVPCIPQCCPAPVKIQISLCHPCQLKKIQVDIQKEKKTRQPFTANEPFTFISFLRVVLSSPLFFSPHSGWSVFW